MSPASKTAAKTRALAAIGKLKADHDKAKEAYDAAMVRAVAQARAEGAEWTEVGRELGQAGTNVSRKFRHRLRTTRTVEIVDE